MSFFKSIGTNVARAKQVALSKVGQAETTVDQQFSQAEAQFKEQHAKIKKLYKVLQKYQKSLFEVGNIQNGVSATMVEQYKNTDPLFAHAKALKEQVSPEIEQFRMQLEKFYADNFYAPIDRYLQQYKALEERINERNRRLVDMDRYNSEVKSLTAKPNTVPTQLQVARDKAESKRIEYESLNAEIISDIQKLIADRSRFFDALFANLIKGQVDYLAQTSNVLGNFNARLSHVNKSATKEFVNVITDPAVSAVRDLPADMLLTQQQTTHQPPPVARAAPPVPAHASAQPVATALYPFQGQDASELTFQAGEKIVVLRQMGDWWEGELRGRRGLFPSNYVKL